MVSKYLVLLLATLSLASGIQPSFAQPQGAQLAVVGEDFALAFLDHRGSATWARIHVSMSQDNTNWVSANFPDMLVNHTKTGKVSGVGICGSSDRKTLMVVFNNTYRRQVFAVSGQVTGRTVAWGGLTLLEGAAADGAPSCAFLDDRRIVVGMKFGNSALVGVYGHPESGRSHLIAQAIPTSENLSSSAPVVAVAGNTVTMAWASHWNTSSCKRIHIAQGDVTGSDQTTSLTLPKFMTLSLTNVPTPAVEPCAMSAPALFTDGKHLYAGLVQSKPGTYDTAIYQSSSIDLTSGWSQLLPGIPLDRRIGYVSGAAKELGTIVFGRVRDLTGRNEVKAFVRANDTWQDLGRTPWATGGSDASYKPFGFARLGSQKKLSIIKEVAPQETLPIER